MTPSLRNERTLTARSLLGWLAGGLAATLLAGLACSFLGRLDVPLDARLLESVVWLSRVYRLVAAAVVGAGLATAGLALQALLRNPLAEPYVLGISSGAGVGVLLGGPLAAAALLPAWVGTFVLAALGGLLTAGGVYLVAQRRGRLNPYALLLTGVIVNVFNGALILTILQFVKQEEMIHFIGWGMGQIPESMWFDRRRLLLAGAVVLVGWGGLVRLSGAFNLLSLGDDVAASSGVSVHRLRVGTFAVASLMTAAAVAIAGPVGFVGLLVPHVCRLLLGPDHRRLILAAGFAGAVFLMFADTACRLVGLAFGRGEIPVGVVTAIVGGPAFILLLRRGLREEQP